MVMKSFAFSQLGLLLASCSQFRGTFALAPVQQHAQSGNAFGLQQERLTQHQLQGIRKMTKHLKRIDEGIDQNTDDYYLGYKPQDENTAWAKYFNDTPVSFSQEFLSGLAVSLSIWVSTLPNPSLNEWLTSPTVGHA